MVDFILGLFLGVIAVFIVGLYGCKTSTEEEVIEGWRLVKEFPMSMKWGTRKKTKN